MGAEETQVDEATRERRVAGVAGLFVHADENRSDQVGCLSERGGLCLWGVVAGWCRQNTEKRFHQRRRDVR